MKNFLVVFLVFTTTWTILEITSHKKTRPIPYNPYINRLPVLPPEPEIPPANITNPFPDYQDYNKIVSQLQEWNKESPQLTEVGTYGKTSRGKDIYYIRLNDKRHPGKPVVLITACIHGNEPLATSTTMTYIGTMLSKFGRDNEITELMKTRDIYFVPVVSPDSYPNSRHVDGVDPNRNFPRENSEKQSVPPVQALKEFFLKIKPKAVISGHTWGRVYLVPYGDKMQHCENKEDYARIMDKMSELSGYRWMRACDLYTANGLNVPPIRYGNIGWDANYMSPIYGTEVDWYYRNGAIGIVCEFGTHQRIPSRSDIEDEHKRTYQAFLHFVKEAPLVEVKK